MDPIVKRIQDLKSGLDGLISEIRHAFTDVSRDVNANQKISTLCDLGYLAKKLEDQFDELRKDSKVLQEKSAKFLALLVIRDNINSDNSEDTAQGEISRAVIKLAMDPEMPEPQSPDWYRLHAHFGMTREQTDGGLVKLSWTELSKAVTEAAENGTPLPPGMKGSRAKYYASFYPRKSK